MEEYLIIQGLKVECENVPYEAVKSMPKKPIKELTCCCFGERAQGRQWWNRDIGFGLCVKCADVISKKEDKETMLECYGERGFHYDIQGK